MTTQDEHSNLDLERIRHKIEGTGMCLIGEKPGIIQRKVCLDQTGEVIVTTTALKDDKSVKSTERVN